MSRLLMIRHGQTAHNAEGRLSTATPGDQLSDQGVGQAERLAELLSPTPLAAIYTSPLIRARQTAEAIARRQGLRPTVHNGLAEISAGELDGRTDAEAFAVLNRALDAWCRCDYSVRIGRDGEIGTDACARFAHLVGELSRLHPDDYVALVSHGGLLQVGVPWVAANLPLGFALRRPIKNTAVIELEVAGGVVHCTSWEGKSPHELIGG